MKKILFVILCLLPFFSCKKEIEDIEYISHDSEIFLNEDSVFIGKWDYLFTWSGGGIVINSTKSYDNLPTLNIKPKGNYEILRDDQIIITGVLDTAELNSSLLVLFYPNGIKKPNPPSQTFQIQGTDTLVLGLPASGDWYSYSYYKRLKD